MDDIFSLQLIDFLASPAGSEALKLSEELDPSHPNSITKLRKICTADQARAVIEVSSLRKRAKHKFRLADQMIFDKQGLEQSTGEEIACYKARRFEKAGCVGNVFDLCCGIGGDAIGLAERCKVIACDLSAVHSRMARWNLAVYGRGENASVVTADVNDIDPEGGMFHIDPDRRAGGRRGVTLDSLEPGVGFIDRLVLRVRSGAVKLSPACDYESLVREGERELVSFKGECKQLILWTGRLADGGRRATVLPGGESVTDKAEERLEVSQIKDYVYDPDGSVTRLRLLGQLAGMLGLDFIYPGLVVLTGDRQIDSKLARCYRVEEVLPFHQSKYIKHVKHKDVGTVTVKTRGVKVDVDKLSKQLSGKEGPCKTVFLLRLKNRIIAVMTTPV